MSQEVISELIAAGDFLAINGTDGMCRRWERAKVAYAATLRQQAGRVDEVTDEMVERAWLAYDEAVETCAESELPAKLRVAMQAALTAALAQNTQGDWVLVPREPTPEMAASFGYMATHGFHACYESMLSAAPPQRAEVDSCGFCGKPGKHGFDDGCLNDSAAFTLTWVSK